MDESNNLSEKKEYISRRKRRYDDSDSEDKEFIETEGSSGYVDTGNIVYMDTKGNSTTLKPNIRFTSYKSVFKDLLK